MTTTPMRLSHLLTSISQAVVHAVPDAVWVTAEILNISGGNYKRLELVEYDDQRKEVAKTTALIWARDTKILTAFHKATGMPIAAGMKVLIQVKPSFHEVFGLSLTVFRIDPTYTLGDMEARINKIRAMLKDKGWYKMNSSLPKPQDYTRVAVISPRDAAGLGDFRVEADKLHEKGLCDFVYFPSLFQGDKACDNIVEQMIAVHSAHQKTPFDALVLIRGGGDKAGLYQLNEQRLSVAVCRFPIPVLVGLGHERDQVFIEEVASIRCGTPSLLIGLIKQRIVDNAQQAYADIQFIKHRASQVIEQATNQAQSLAHGLRTQALERLTQIERIADVQRQDIVSQARQQATQAATQAQQQREGLLSQAYHLLTHTEQISGLLMAQLMSSNPLAILDKGYSYVQKAGHVVVRPQDLSPDDQIDIHFKSFTVTAKVEDIHEQ